MSGAADNLAVSLAVAELRRIDAVCIAFESAWKSGQHPAIESFCGDSAGPERAALLRELLLLEIDYRQRGGETPNRPHYETRFPADRCVIDGVFRFLVASAPARATVGLGQAVGNYTLLEELGRGGMGVVFKARQTGLNRVVALKMMLDGPHAVAEQAERFHQEAAAAANLQHPNIVAIHEVGEHEGQPFLCMDYVQGQSLREVVREGPLPVHRAAQYVKTIAEAIHYAHQQGTLHRDLKPANVLIDRADQPRITDFGLAKHVKGSPELTGSGQALGTPGYMPPEQASGRRGQVGPVSDVYSVGAILYELTTGRPPFHAETPTDTLLQVLQLEPVPPRLLNPKLPRDLETICLTCLQKEPARRYASADALAQDLGRFLRNEPIRARPVGRLERTWRWCRRQSLAASLAAAVVVTLLAGTVVSWFFAMQAYTRAREATHFALEADTRTREATSRLWRAYLAQAQAGRRSGIPGQRFESLQALAAAAAIRPSKELRDEAITCMGLGDLQVQRQWPCACIGDSAVQFSAKLDCYAGHDQHRTCWVRWVAGDREPFPLPGPYRRQEDFLFSPRGRWLAEKCVANNTAECRVWDVDRRQVMLSAPATTDMGGIEFHPDGRSIVIAGPDQSLHFFRVEDRAHLRSWNCDPLPNGIAFHPAGRRMAVFRRMDHVVRILDADTGHTVRTLSHGAGVWAVAWHPHGSLLATSCGDFSAYLWNVETGRLQTVLRGHQSDVVSVMFNRTGELLATYSWDGTTRLWDPATGQQLLSTSGEFRRFSENDERLAFWRYNVMGVWTLAKPDCRTLREISPARAGPWGASFSRDGRLLASASDDGVRVWDLLAGGDREVAFLPLGYTATALFSPTGNSLLTAGAAGLQQWPITIDRQAGRLLIGPFTLLVPPESLPCARACLDQEGRLAAVTIRPDRIALLDLTRPAEKRVVQDRIGVEFVSLTPDGQWMATSVFHGVGGVRIWDVRRGALVHTILHESPRAKVLFSPDGKWLLTSTDQEFQFWESGTWRPDWRIPREDLGLFGPMVFSPDARVLAVACSRYAVQLVDVATKRLLARLESPTPQHLAWLCFSSDGTQLAATSENHTIQVWDLRAIRQRLAAMNLDWKMPPYASPCVTQPPQPLSVKVMLE